MPASDATTVLEVARDDAHRTRVVEEPAPSAGAGEAVLRVERFGLTANNVTYAVLGDMLGYWRFFPAEDGWGRVPAWGFATVVSSAAADLPEGTRIFGYLPMAGFTTMTPVAAGEGTVREAAAHRADLPGTYNEYQLAGPAGGERADDELMLLRPLFMTSALLDAQLGELAEGEAVVLSSASSKTAAGTAFLLCERGVEVVGLTSPGGVDFVRGLGAYANVLPYAEAGSLDLARATFVDVAGDADVRAAVHGTLGDRLARSYLLGATHWEDGVALDGAPLPGPEPELFFAPATLERLRSELGPEEFLRQMGERWGRLIGWSRGWLRIERADGPAAVEAGYARVAAGELRRDTGLSVSMHAA
jgi:hypothetical protein